MNLWGAKMITVDQLLESVDLDFEPRWVTKDLDGEVNIWDVKPVYRDDHYGLYSDYNMGSFGTLKLAEFEGKNWTECIYEVPRKTTGKIEKLEMQEISRGGENMVLHIQKIPATAEEMHEKINELVGYVNALIESNNIHEKQIDELQMKLEPEKCAVNELKGE